VNRLGTPITSSRVAMVRAGAALLATGGVLSLLTLAVPHYHLRNQAGAVTIAAVALPTAALLVTFAKRVPQWLIHVLVLSAIAELSVGIHFAGPGARAATTASFYVWLVVYAFYFLSRRAAIAYLVCSAVAYGAVLATQHDHGAPGQWLVVMGTAAVGGVVVGLMAERLRALAGTDSLTGLATGRSWEAALERELARAWRQHVPVSVAVIDLDEFKQLNDREGHGAGDVLLKQLGSAWADTIRDEDVLARPGGDEFGLLFPNCGQEAANRILDRLRAQTPGVTFSAGLASWDGSEHATSLMERAGLALYRAKNRGGGNTVVAGAPRASEGADL
jgi:diguanylate cyclase (GGDEF)-like protein